MMWRSYNGVKYLKKGEPVMKIEQSRMEEFAQLIKGKRNVYCFGAGVALVNFLSEFQRYQIENEIKYIVDNSFEKQGTEMQCNNSCISVISPDQMLHQIVPEDVILITTAKETEVIEQLNEQRKLKDISCYLYTILRMEQYDYERLNIKIPQTMAVYQEQRIPKVIHYCWFGKNEIPNQCRKWMESWKHYCPDYEIIEWNEDNYDVHKSLYISQAYELGKWAFVSDYARIDIIHEYGGVYLDTDVELLKNMDVMLRNDAFCGFETNKYVAYGLGFGAKRHHPIVSEIKEYYDNICFVSESGVLNQTTCPVIQTNVMKQHGLICNGEFQFVDDMTVYPSRILCGMSPHSFRVQRDLKYTYAIHHYASSWDDDQKWRWRKNMILCMKKWDNSDLYFYPD